MPQVVEVVCCRMTEMQAGLYTHFLTSNAARRLLAGQKAARVLSAITGTLADTPPLLCSCLRSSASTMDCTNMQACVQQVLSSAAMQ